MTSIISIVMLNGTYIICLRCLQVYKPLYSAHANNSHCLAQAVNTLFAALFTFCGRAQDIEERLKEFLAVRNDINSSGFV